MHQSVGYILFAIIAVGVLYAIYRMKMMPEQNFATYIMQDRSDSKNHLVRPDNTLGWPYSDGTWSRTYTEG